MAKTWCLITGVSAGGIGDALVTEFLARGINVIATGLRLSDLDYLPDSVELKLEKLELDVTSSTSIAAAVRAVESITSGKLNILVNNAGYGYMMPVLDASIQEIKKNFDVNVFGLIAVTQALFPLVRAAKGMIVNQSSIAGQPGISQPFIGAYSASKTAVTDFSDTMRVEFVPFDVKVITLFTGDIHTDFWRNTAGTAIGLPEDSPYTLHKDHVEAMMRGQTNPGYINPRWHTKREVWAKAVVNDLLQPNPSVYVRRGALSSIMWVVSWLAPRWLLDWGFTTSCKFVEFKARLEAVESKKNR